MKKAKPKATKARQAARGKPCMIRLPGCDGGGETTVLAHYRLAGYCGTGIKPDDFSFGAYACYHCHDVCDGRTSADHISRDQIRLAHAEGVMRTQKMLIDEGVICESSDQNVS
ncbi:DUF1364 domain-containing protein [Litorivivens sp.]|uniref:DUF1364 domain-containing protein n=1 Tax=Litorivivens sp. TaxID=2020868 RepID=UPI00356A6D29